MGKLCRKSALKTSPIPILVLVNSPKQQMVAKDLKIRYFKRDYGKDNLMFSFARTVFL